MGLVFATYTNCAYKEISLPVIDNSNYKLVLRASEFGLSEDLCILMEVVNGSWSFRRSAYYRVLHQGESIEKQPVRQGMILQIYPTKADDRTTRIVIMVWDSRAELTAYEKYRVAGNKVTIGRAKDNDICYASNQIIGRHHAQIEYQGQKAILLSHSRNGTYVGQHRVQERQELEFGDAISLFGLTVIYLGEVLAVSWLKGDVIVGGRDLMPLSGLAIDEKTRAIREDYSSEQMVHISPRTIPELYSDTETLENVPPKQEGEDKPAWMSVLPPLTMVLPMILGYSLMSQGNMAMGIVISAGSAIVGVIWAVIGLNYAKKKEKEREHNRLQRYEQYLVQRSDIIKEKYEFNRKTMLEMYPDAQHCSSYDANSMELWTRKPTHSDSLFIRLGLGDVPFQVKIVAPVQGFSLTDDELAERPEKIASRYEVISLAPVGLDLAAHDVIGILGGKNPASAIEIIRVLIAQIAASFCYTEVKICVLYNGALESADNWSFVRWLPHVWNEERSMRYVADDSSGSTEVLYNLTQILRSRSEQRSASVSKDTGFLPHYVLIVENPEMLESQIITKYLYEGGNSLGFTTILMSDSYENLPSACDCVIEHSESFHGIYGTREGGQTRQTIEFDTLDRAQMEKMARRMCSMRVNQVESSTDIPDSITFFEMMGIRQLDELNVLDHWRKNRTYESMRALIGKKVGGQDCYLDINEKYHGPHGLVAGTTGSGKSETLQTYILSLAVNFSPLDVGFFIIDFKGGGMANLFSNLPHTIGEISNLSGNQVRRAMVSIKSENRRRQRIFGEFGVNHIDAYTKLVKSKEASVPIPHLLIIIDEFAELKREEPEFMRELISVAQVGRSLGVHLILATQKPSGTVDDNIWSNTKFKLCLRVADKQDSNDMLHKPDAAYLTQAGRCYLQVGNDEIYELFQSGWSGATYNPDGQGNQNSAVLLDLQGRAAVSGSRAKGERKRRQVRMWMIRVVRSFIHSAQELSVLISPQLDEETCSVLAKRAAAFLNESDHNCYPESAASLRRLEDVVRLWPTGESEPEKIADAVMDACEKKGIKLPEAKEKTQLDAMVAYLAQIAAENGFVNEQMLWMPVLPDRLILSQISGYKESAFRDGRWSSHPGSFQLSTFVGMVDDPENQMQFPLLLDFARKGHLAVVGGVTSGKSTFLQTILYGLITRYSPEELNLYIVDFSSLMLCAFEKDAHVGGIVTEGEDDRLKKLFGLMEEMLKQRKQQIRGGSFSQYVQKNGHELPAVMLVIDGYANFREKTEDRFESILLELSRSAEGYGIYLMISCAGYGGTELQSKIADNMRQSICLELGDKYRYGEALRTMHFDVLPEQNVKGRGLVSLDGNVLEYQTALACEAENDYTRSEKIGEYCAEMTEAWKGKKASPIPSIPAKPVWKSFSETDEYKRLIQEGNRLPVAYFQENASLYCVELSKIFCYLITGGDRSGKSVFLRNVACSVRDIGGKLYLVDRENGKEAGTAQCSGAEYFAASADLLQLVRELLIATNERAVYRKQLMLQGLEDEELYAEMSRKYSPIVVLFADLNDFMNRIYTDLEGIGKLNQRMENIFAKGQRLNVFFFGVAGVDDLLMMSDKSAYHSFTHDHQGILLAGELSSQTVFSYQNVPYAEQTKRLKIGYGYATNQEDEQRVDLVVVPNNREVRK